jgi:hypothetical protein
MRSISAVMFSAALLVAVPSFAQTTQTPTVTPTAPEVKPAAPAVPAPVAPAVPAPVVPAPADAPPAAGTNTEPTVEEAPPDTDPDPSAADTEGGSDDGLSVGEIPAVETEELTPEKAKKALDAYVMVHDKYKDSPLENYEDLQAFVDKDPKGKEFESDVKTFGFTGVNDWNLAITTLSFAYTNVLDDQTSDIKQQIEEITADTELAQDMKDRMIQSLKAMIPSDNNRKIVDDLMKDAAYGEKIKLLETTEE